LLVAPSGARNVTITFGRYQTLALYETVFIVRPDVSAQHVDGMAGNFAAIVGEGGGSVSKTENWGLRSLAYRVKKNRKGHYVLLNIDAPAAAISEMERNMRIDEDIVRYLTVRVDELEDGPSIVMRAKVARDDRDRDRGRRDRRDEARPAAGVAAAVTPATETPKAEIPATETPKAEIPATETPKAEIPATETPGSGDQT
jgi:small subunit ribosomal protein S6